MGAFLMSVGLHEAESIAAIARPADVAEISEALGIPMDQAIRDGITSSYKVQKIVCGGDILAVVGDAAHDDRIGIPWMITTIHVEKHATAFLRVCKPLVADMLNRHEQLLNFVDARNVHAVRWLAWLGFDIGPPMPYGPKGILFHPFETHRGN